MNPNYLWLTEAIELLSFLVLMPAIAIAIAYAAWQRKAAERQPEAVRDGVRRIRRHCLSAVGACEPDECRYQTMQYFLQLACLLSALLLFGVSMGCGFPVLLHFWRWHRATRLTDGKPTER